MRPVRHGHGVHGHASVPPLTPPRVFHFAFQRPPRPRPGCPAAIHIRRPVAPTPDAPAGQRKGKGRAAIARPSFECLPQPPPSRARRAAQAAPAYARLSLCPCTRRARRAPYPSLGAPVIRPACLPSLAGSRRSAIVRDRHPAPTGPRKPQRLVAPGRFSGCLRHTFSFHRRKSKTARPAAWLWGIGRGHGFEQGRPGRDHAGIPCIADRTAPDESDAALCVRNGAALPEGGKTAALWRGGERIRFGCKPSCYPAAWRFCRASTILKRLFRTWGAVGGGAQCAYFFSSLADCRYRSSSRSTRFLAIWYGSLTGRATVFSCGEPSRRRI